MNMRGTCRMDEIWLRISSWKSFEMVHIGSSSAMWKWLVSAILITNDCSSSSRSPPQYLRAYTTRVQQLFMQRIRSDRLVPGFCLSRGRNRGLRRLEAWLLVSLCVTPRTHPPFRKCSAYGMHPRSLMSSRVSHFSRTRRFLYILPQC